MPQRRLLRAAVRDHFKRRADTTRQMLRPLFRLGRRSLMIGLTYRHLTKYSFRSC